MWLPLINIDYKCDRIAHMLNISTSLLLFPQVMILTEDVDVDESDSIIGSSRTVCSSLCRLIIA